MSLSGVLLFLPLLGLCSGQALQLNCQQVPGSLKQIDVGNGQVFGVNANDNIYTLYGSGWKQIPGALKHITVGAAGVWGVNGNNNIYKLVGGNWVQIDGRLKQIDAGGAQFLSGANMNDDIFCLHHQATVSTNDGSTLPWSQIEGQLKYYSCGPLGCWGVNSADDIYYRASITPSFCSGCSWQKVEGKLSMIEVGSDGSVYGVNSVGAAYRRNGMSASNPIGISWTQLQYKTHTFRHLSQDLGLLWVLTKEQTILKCTL